MGRWFTLGMLAFEISPRSKKTISIGVRLGFGMRRCHAVGCVGDSHSTFEGFFPHGRAFASDPLGRKNSALPVRTYFFHGLTEIVIGVYNAFPNKKYWVAGSKNQSLGSLVGDGKALPRCIHTSTGTFGGCFSL